MRPRSSTTISSLAMSASPPSEPDCSMHMSATESDDVVAPEHTEQPLESGDEPAAGGGSSAAGTTRDATGVIADTLPSTTCEGDGGGVSSAPPDGPTATASNAADDRSEPGAGLVTPAAGMAGGGDVGALPSKTTAASASAMAGEAPRSKLLSPASALVGLAAPIACVTGGGDVGAAPASPVRAREGALWGVRAARTPAPGLPASASANESPA